MIRPTKAAGSEGPAAAEVSPVELSAAAPAATLMLRLPAPVHPVTVTVRVFPDPVTVEVQPAVAPPPKEILEVVRSNVSALAAVTLQLKLE